MSAIAVCEVMTKGPQSETWSKSPVVVYLGPAAQTPPPKNGINDLYRFAEIKADIRQRVEVALATHTAANLLAVLV